MRIEQPAIGRNPIAEAENAKRIQKMLAEDTRVQPAPSKDSILSYALAPLMILYYIGVPVTFLYLTFLDGIEYTAINLIPNLLLNSLSAVLWPGYLLGHLLFS